MNLEFLDKDSSVTDAYYVANTPFFLYKLLRNNPIVQLLSEKPTSDLITEFKKRASQPIKNSSDLAKIYAIFVALSYKEPGEVGQLFHEAKSIPFEWFSDIAEYYIKEYKPTPLIQSFTIEESPKIIEPNLIPADSNITFA